MTPVDAAALRLLVVEDNPDLRRLAETMLRRTLPAAVVDSCGLAQEAVALLELTRYDAVLVDLLLPDVSDVGESIARVYAARAVPVPIVAWTGVALRPEEQLELIEQGADSILWKPAIGNRWKIVARVLLEAIARERRWVHLVGSRAELLVRTAPGARLPLPGEPSK